MNPGGGEIFRTCPDRPWYPPSLLYNGYRAFPGGKERPGRDPELSPPSSAVGHERVELYLYSPYGPYGLYRASVPVQGCTLLLPFISKSRTKARLQNILFCFCLSLQYLSRLQDFQKCFEFSLLRNVYVGTANCRPAKSAKDRVQFWAFALAMSEYNVIHLK